MVWLILLTSLWRSLAFGQTSLADLASYSGPDRMEKLISGAKREGAVVVYTSALVEDATALTAAFEHKYGTKLRVWRASSENIVQRGLAEARSGRFDVDVFETGGVAMESLQREQLLQQVKTPALSNLIPATSRPHGEWTGTRLNIFAAAYNTDLIKKDELPKSYDDLLDPRWKGKLGVEADDNDWFGGVVSALGEERGLRLFRDIVARNGISVRKGHTLLANLVASGEVPFALTTYAVKPEQLKQNGAPIAWYVLPPGIARFEGAGVARHAPHPAGALLFLEFMLTDAQDLLRQRSFFTGSSTGRLLPEGVSLTFLDPAQALDNDKKWSKLFRDIISNPVR
jgi:iron(III) transport system substrate-binding protein